MTDEIWGLTFDEWFHARMEPGDIHSYAYQPLDVRRYEASGLKKLREAGLTLDVRDFGAAPESP